MSNLFREFATSTSKGRTGTVLYHCLVCGETSQTTTEVNGFNEWAFERDYNAGPAGYFRTEAMRHSACIKSGRKDYSYLAVRDIKRADVYQSKEQSEASLSAEDFSFDDLDLDSL